jgi:hypothetical protein
MSMPLLDIALLLLFVAGVLIAGLLAHLHYFMRITGRVKKTTDQDFLREDLKSAMRIPQGSNFNILMLLSWSLFVVAFAFLFFLTPDIFPKWNYFRFPQVASDSFGLVYFGSSVIILLGILVSLFVPHCYGYYQISRPLKRISLFIPLFLLASISCSVYLGTIYPEPNSFCWYMGYGAILIALVLMFAPIGKGYMEEMRT